MNLHLVEIDYLDPVTMGVSTLRFSSGDGGYCSRPTDSLPNTYFEPRLKVPSNYQITLFKDGVKGGCAQGGFGTAQFMNHDGWFDQFYSKCFDGQKFRLLYGEASASYDEYVVLLTGTMCQPEYSWGYFNLKVRDYTQFFNRAASQNTYLGNNVAGVGVEGTPDDLMDKSKPLCFGRCLNVPLTYVSASNSIYQIHDGAIYAVDAVYSNGGALTLDTTQGTAGDCASLDALVAASPAAGSYCTCLALGFVRVTGAADTTLTADVRGAVGSGGYSESVPGITKMLAADYTRRKRQNFCLQNENRGDASWVKTGFTVGSAAASTPINGMAAVTLTGATGSTLAKTHDIPTSMICYGEFLLAGSTTQIELRVENAANAANNVLAQFDLSAGTVLAVQSNGAAVGPQYTATGFITDAGIVVYPHGYFFVWVSGQPDQSFAQIKTTLKSLNGTGLSIGGAQIEKTRSPSLYTGPTTTSVATAYDPTTAPPVNAASFASMESVIGSVPVGYYVEAGGTDTVGAIMEALGDSLGCFTAQNRQGELVIGRLAKPSTSATPVATFTETEILQDSINSVSPYSSSDGTPAYRIVLQASKNWTVQRSSEVLTSLWDTNPMRVVWLQKEFREVRAEDYTVLAAHPFACEISKTSLIVKQTDALAEARRLLQYYSGVLSRYSFSVKIPYAANVNIGDIVALDLARFGLSGGINFLVVGVVETHESGRVGLEVMG